LIADAAKETPAALDRLEASCRAAGVAEALVLDLRIVGEEVLTNIAKHAYAAGTTAAAELAYSLSETEAVLEFRDQGMPFDPLAHPPPDLDTAPDERPAGGMGLPLIRALVDEARYVREGPTNVLRLVKRRAPQ
jgi:anti-sigma regulatory factor (Ser/Thr protein kinase)